MDGILWFAKQVIFGAHYRDVNCSIILKKLYMETDFVLESSYLFIFKGRSCRRHTMSFDLNSVTYCNDVLLEFQDVIDENKNKQKLKFQKLSEKAKIRRWASEGSVDYHLFSAVYKSIIPQSCEAIATNITLISLPGLYPRFAPRSSMTLKNTDVGAVVIDIDYRGTLKVVIMNQSTVTHLHIELGDRIAQFIMMRFKTPELVKVV